MHNKAADAGEQSWGFLPDTSLLNFPRTAANHCKHNKPMVCQPITLVWLCVHRESLSLRSSFQGEELCAAEDELRTWSFVGGQGFCRSILEQSPDPVLMMDDDCRGKALLYMGGWIHGSLMAGCFLVRTWFLSTCYQSHPVTIICQQWYPARRQKASVKIPSATFPSASSGTCAEE